jgi:hypothetical protein
MFITKEQAENLTGYEVDSTLLTRAQSIIEAYVGRVEGEVDDAGDLALLGKATAYQAAYMKENSQLVFEQASVVSVNNFGSAVEFTQNGVSPHISTLAVIACRNLSWRRSRSIYTGSMFGNASYRDRWETE